MENIVVLSTTSLEFIMGLITGVTSGLCMGYFIYLNKEGK